MIQGAALDETIGAGDVQVESRFFDNPQRAADTRPRVKDEEEEAC